MQRQRSSSQEPPPPKRKKVGFVVHPCDEDVLMGRGSGSNEHFGNCAFRDEIRNRMEIYRAKNTSYEKEQIEAEVVSAICNRGGRFLKRIPQAQVPASKIADIPITVYEIVSDTRIILDKVKQAFRYTKVKEDTKKLKEIEEDHGKGILISAQAFRNSPTTSAAGFHSLCNSPTIAANYVQSGELHLSLRRYIRETGGGRGSYLSTGDPAAVFQLAATLALPQDFSKAPGLPLTKPRGLLDATSLRMPRIEDSIVTQAILQGLESSRGSPYLQALALPTNPGSTTRQEVGLRSFLMPHLMALQREQETQDLFSLLVSSPSQGIGSPLLSSIPSYFRHSPGAGLNGILAMRQQPFLTSRRLLEEGG